MAEVIRDHNGLSRIIKQTTEGKSWRRAPGDYRRNGGGAKAERRVGTPRVSSEAELSNYQGVGPHE